MRINKRSRLVAVSHKSIILVTAVRKHKLSVSYLEGVRAKGFYLLPYSIALRTLSLSTPRFDQS